MVIAANIIDFVACILMVATGSIKKKEKLGSTSKIRNERGEITTDITEIQRDHKRIL